MFKLKDIEISQFYTFWTGPAQLENLSNLRQGLLYNETLSRSVHKRL